MIEEQASILALTNTSMVVEIKRQSSCNSCSAKSSCGTSALSQLFGQRPAHFTLDLQQCASPSELQVGDVIMLGLDDLSYVKASLLMYLLPLLSLLAFALLAEQFLAFNEFFVMLFAVFGLWLGFKLAKIKSSKNTQQLTPQFIKKL